MGEEVRLQVGALVEVSLADGAAVRGVLHVEDFVDSQSPGLTKALATLIALEGLLFGVNVAVIPKVILPPEGFATDITVVGPLISVGPLMDKKVVRLGELPVAVLADEPLLGPGRPAGPAEQPRIIAGGVGRGNYAWSGGGGGPGGSCSRSGCSKPVSHEEGESGGCGGCIAGRNGSGPGRVNHAGEGGGGRGGGNGGGRNRGGAVG